MVYHEMPARQEPTTKARAYDQLPKAARDYVEVSIFVWASMVNKDADHQQYSEKFVGVEVGGCAYC